MEFLARKVLIFLIILALVIMNRLCIVNPLKALKDYYEQAYYVYGEFLSMTLVLYFIYEHRKTEGLANS